MSLADHDNSDNAALQARIVERVIAEVALIYGLDSQITGRAQTERVAEARAMAIVLAAEMSTASAAQVAQRFSGRAPSAVQVARKTYARHFNDDRDGFRGKVMTVRRRVREVLA